MGGVGLKRIELHEEGLEELQKRRDAFRPGETVLSGEAVQQIINAEDTLGIKSTEPPPPVKTE